nr:immunoglobulin heavy chain junction region [Macaca mulatta]
CARHPDPRYW